MTFPFIVRLRSAGILALLGLLLTACGFQLREAQPLPFKSIHVSLPEQSELGAALRRQLRSSGTVLADTPSSAEAILSVVTNAREKSILSLNAAGRVREFRLRQRFAFRLHDSKGREFMPISEIQITRDISYSDTELLAKDAEEALLYRDMQNDLVQQVMRRLAAATVK